ncbi:unnamed protein product [Tuber aestivum]|uniref:Autophagy-related protein 9 n=1 Tax=Tuber aestivum TaxID=59557 RepID=A0A292PI76_9PEZI|nr:unnamed protein product [Tuber aestivum]
MTSRILSQIFNQNSASIYETLRQHDATDNSDDDDDLEERAGMLALDNDSDLPPPDLQDSLEDSNFELEQQPPAPAESSFMASENNRRPYFSSMSRSKKNIYAPPRYRDEEEGDDEVPASLLLEVGAGPSKRRGSTGGRSGVAGPALRAVRNEPLPNTWAATGLEGHQAREERRGDRRHQNEGKDFRRQARLGLIDPKERALWKWANVENLDNFLNDVYDYFLGKGIWSIALHRLLNQLTLVFVVGFTTFMSLCVDYKLVPDRKKLSEVISPHCMSQMSGVTTLFMWAISFYWVIKTIHYVLDTRRLWDIRNFYKYLLEIPDSDMQTVTWQEVVAKLMALRDSNPTTSGALRRRHFSSQSKQRMDAHDIANRLMRKENYLIALFNKEILDLTIPFPFLRNRGTMLTKTLEWNLSLCILDYVFNDQGQLRTLFLKESHRKILSDGLKRRFLFAGVMNIIFAPFILTYLLLLFLLRNVNDFIKTPARIGHRQYTPLAEWKFREFNELYHIFHMRLNMSYPAAEAYVEQFPKEKTAQVARFVSFVAGSLLGVLAIASIIDGDLIQGFEIVQGLNGLTAIATLTTIVAVSRGMLPEENTVYDPEWSIRNVIQHIHYMPDHWKDKLRTDDIKKEFMSLYDLKVMIFLGEVMSVIFTPFVLWVSLSNRSEKIIDFFREFTVHVDGIGYVCSFAVFDFQKPGRQSMADLREEYFSSKDNKMLSSYLGFMDQYHGPQNKGGANKRQMSMRNYMSPVLNAQTGKGRDGRGDGRQDIQLSIHRDSPGRMQGSQLLQSSLLDQHHQPPPFMGRATRHPMFHLPTAESLREEEEEEATPSTDKPREHYRSNLGESFMSTRVTGTMMATQAEDEEEDQQAGPHNAGVLDLLNQFVGVEGAGRTGVI